MLRTFSEHAIQCQVRCCIRLELTWVPGSSPGTAWLRSLRRVSVRHPEGGPDLAEFTCDLAPGRAGILTDVHLTEQAERHNAVGVSGMCGKAPHSRIGL